jgi:hypothetical protein
LLPDGNVIPPPPVTANLAGGKTTIPVNQNVVIQFNRLLNPATVNRQTVTLLTAGGELPVDPFVDYDPVLLTVTLSNPGGGAQWLVEGQVYQVLIPVATDTTEGVLAIDDATMPGPGPTQLDFMAVAAEGDAPTEPTMNFCVDVLPIFSSTGKCTAGQGGCHSHPTMGSLSQFLPDGSPPPDGSSIVGATAGLVLDSSEGVASTAVGKVAYESNVGLTAGPSSGSCPTTDTQTCPFGVNMPIIDPGTNGSGNPGNSWLLYKVLLALPPSKDEGLLAQCAPFSTTPYTANPPVVATPTTNPPVAITPQERARLSNYIPGREMPYPSNPSIPEGSDASTGAIPLSMQELERVRLWIKQGATTPDCSRCACEANYELIGKTCQPTSIDGGIESDAASRKDASSTMDAKAGSVSDGGTKG